MTNRGVLYVVWGESIESQLARSMASVRKWHPELPIHVERLPDGSTLLDKAKMYDLSPFDETLCLDADTVVLGDLSFGFEQAARYWVACCINECPWARRYDGLQFHGDVVEYNTGVLFFRKSPDVAAMFEAWKSRVGVVNSRLPFLTNSGTEAIMPLNDQASFAAAVAEWGKSPAVLPLNWNFRPRWHWTWFGPVKIWHDYTEPTAEFLDGNRKQSDPENIITFQAVQS